MDMLEIFLLGSPEVHWKGETITLPRRMSRALLFYLALASRASRSDLRTLFWPEEEEDEKARANLRVALTRLRAGLPDPELLVVDPDTIALNREKVRVDAALFLELSEPALRAAAPITAENPLPERLVLALRQAAELWRAPRVLSGFTFAEDSPELDHWQLTTAQQHEELYLRVITRLANHFAAAGDFDTALSWAQTGLQIDPWADDLHIRILRCLLALGRSGAALAHAQPLAERFASAGLEISAALSALIHQVRRGSAAEAPPIWQGWPAARLTKVSLVGRAAPLKTLQTAFQRGGVVGLWGEAGSGKTRLAYEFYSAQQPRPRVLLLNCLQGENRLPFQPLSDALQRSIRQEEWRRLKPTWLHKLAYLLPELAEVRPAPPTDETQPVELQRSHIFEALRQLLLEISRTGKLLVVLEGAQWCDDATLAALAYLNQRSFFQERGLLLLAARPEEHNPALEEWLGGLRGTSGFQELQLPALNPAETVELARQVLDQPVSAAVGQQLCADTGGNPLFLLETLFALLENAPAAGIETALAQPPLGGSLHNLLRQRLARLGPVTRQVAAAAAVLRAEFTPGLLAEIAQLNLETVVQALDELIKARLMQPVPSQSTAAYTFIHGQIRDVLRWEQGPARLRMLHLRAAHARADQPTPLPYQTERVAYHYEQAGERLQAFEHWMQAGRQARVSLSIAEAVQAFRAAESLVPDLKARLSDETLYELYSAWSETLIYGFADTPFKEQLYQRLLSLGEERRSPLLIGTALSEQANLLANQNDPERALDMFQRAAYHLNALPNPLPAVRNDYLWGWYLMRRMRYNEAARLLERALTSLGPSTAPAPLELRTNLEFRLGMLYLFTGWPAKAHTLAAQALRQTSAPGAIYGHLVFSRAKLFLGELLEAMEHVRLGLQMAASHGSARMTGLFSINQFTLELAMGQIDAAWEHAQAAIELAESHAMPDVLCMALVTQGDIYRLLGDTPAALAAYRAALAAGMDKWDSLTAQVHLGMALADAGEVEAGLRQVAEADAEARRVGLGEIFIQATSTRALLLASGGRLDEAMALLASMAEITAERQYVQAAIVHNVVLCLDALRRGDEPAARAALDRAVAGPHMRLNPFWELFCFHILSRLGPLTELHRSRVQELLDQVLRRTRNPELRPLAEAYCRRNRAALLR